MYSKKYYYSAVIQPKELYRNRYFDTKKVLLSAPARELPKLGIQHKRQLSYKVMVAVMDAILTDVAKGYTFAFPYAGRSVRLGLNRLSSEQSKSIFDEYDWAKECSLMALGHRFYQVMCFMKQNDTYDIRVPVIIGRKYFDLHNHIISTTGKLEFAEKKVKDYFDVALDVCPILTLEGAKFILDLGFRRIIYFLKLGMCVMFKNKGNQFMQFMPTTNLLNWRSRKYFKHMFGFNDINECDIIHADDKKRIILLESAYRISSYFSEEQTPYIAFTKKEREEIAEKGYTMGGMIGRNKRVAEVYSSPAFKLTNYYLLKHDLHSIFEYTSYMQRNNHKITLKEFITDEKSKRKYFQ